MNWDALFNGLLATVFIAMGYEYFQLERRMNRIERPTRLAAAMTLKYRALKYAMIGMAILNGYSWYFAVTRDIWIFTVPVRNGIRAVTFVLLFLGWLMMRRMRREIIRAEEEA